MHGCVAGEIAACDRAVVGRLIHTDLYQLFLGNAVTEVFAASALSVVDVKHDVDLLSVGIEFMAGPPPVSHSEYTCVSASRHVEVRKCTNRCCASSAVTKFTHWGLGNGCSVRCCDCVAAIPSDGQGISGLID